MAIAKAAEIRGPVGDWHALRANPGYKADWRKHGGAPSIVESAGFALRAQTEADLKAARWGLLAWEKPGERSKCTPFWIDEKMLEGAVMEAGDSVGMMARATRMRVSGLCLLDGALGLKVSRGRRVEQIRISEGDSFDVERTGLQLRYPFDGFPPTGVPRAGDRTAGGYIRSWRECRFRGRNRTLLDNEFLTYGNDLGHVRRQIIVPC